MTYEITFVTKGRNYSGCIKIKGYRKDLKKCIVAANNEIEEMLLARKRLKDIKEVMVRITSFGRKVDSWNYIPTFR